LLRFACAAPGAPALTAVALSLLALIVVALILLGGASAVFTRYRWHVMIATAALAGLALLICVLTLAAGGDTAAITIPLGLPGGRMHLALDPLSAFFLLILAISALASAVYDLDPHT